MSVGITVRKKELANLECIGMSRRQVRIMLMSEGLIYAVITLLLVYTAGNAVTYGFFSMFKKEATYAVFTYPIIPVLAASLTEPKRNLYVQNSAEQIPRPPLLPYQIFSILMTIQNRLQI